MSQFKQLPSPYSKYEVSESGSILRAIKTKSIVNVEKGTSSYRVYSDTEKDKRIYLSKEKLSELCKAKIEAGTKELKAVISEPKKKVLLKSSEKTLKTKKLKVSESNKSQTESSIPLPVGSVTYRINLLHHQGKTKQEIISELGITNKTYLDRVWLYKNKNYKEKIEKYLASK